MVFSPRFGKNEGCPERPLLEPGSPEADGEISQVSGVAYFASGPCWEADEGAARERKWIAEQRIHAVLQGYYARSGRCTIRERSLTCSGTAGHKYPYD